MISRRFGSFLLLLIAVSFVIPPIPVYSQDGDSGDTAGDATGDISGAEDDAPDMPLPYDPAEFPAWSRDLRRGEIIALGSFPITMILSGLTYQLGRFAYQSAVAGEPRSEYAPWFFSTGTGPRYNNEERIGLIVSAATLSIGVALLDYVLGRREKARE